MTPWPVRQTFDVVVVGRRLGVLLLAVAVYCSAVGLLVRTFEIRVIGRGTAAGLINTVILSLLLSFPTGRPTSDGCRPGGCGAS